MLLPSVGVGCLPFLFTALLHDCSRSNFFGAFAITARTLRRFFYFFILALLLLRSPAQMFLSRHNMLLSAPQSPKFGLFSIGDSL